MLARLRDNGSAVPGAALEERMRVLVPRSPRVRKGRHVDGLGRQGVVPSGPELPGERAMWRSNTYNVVRASVFEPRGDHCTPHEGRWVHHSEGGNACFAASSTALLWLQKRAPRESEIMTAVVFDNNRRDAMYVLAVTTESTSTLAIGVLCAIIFLFCV